MDVAMGLNWQLIVVVAVVGVAIWHLLRRALAVFRKPGSSSCGSCTSCPEPEEKRLPLVELRDPSKE
jgi:hypothetical protein